MKSLREREIIRIISKRFIDQPGVPLGFEDDVAAIPLSSKTWAILKTDLLVGSTDVPPGMSVRAAARKAVVATVSDFAAKGVQPRALMVSMGLPAPVKKKTVQDLVRGLDEAIQEYGCKIIGGDTSQADDLFIGVTGLGYVTPKKLVRRSGARVGDIVAVTGLFGKSAAGLKILISGEKKDLTRYPSLVNAMLRPRARLAEGIILAQSGGVTSSIDSSDGLAQSVHQIAQASRVGINLHRIPVDATVQNFAKEHRMSAVRLALYGGEEYELVVTITPMRFPYLKRRVRSLRRIGIVEKGHKVAALVDGKRIRFQEQGWEHFA